MIIAIASLKGGTGKTMLATALAAEACRRGLSSLLVDASPQRCASAWAFRAGARAPTTVDLQEPACLSTLAAGYARAWIDLPCDEATTAAVLAQADAVLVPVTCSAGDLPALERLWHLLRHAQLGSSRPSPQVVINRVDVRRTGARAAALRLRKSGIPTLCAAIRERVVVDEALAAGMHLPEVLEGCDAAADILAVYDELHARLDAGFVGAFLH